MPVQRNEAIFYLKEVLSIDKTISPEAITLEKYEDDSSYRVSIKGATKPQAIKDIASKLNLTVIEEKDSIIVCKSK